MTPDRALPLNGVLLLLLSLFAVFQTQALAENDAIKFDTQLIWGTNDKKPEDRDLKDVDAKLIDKLKAVFKWKNYYTVEKKALAVPLKGAGKVKLSDKCELELQDLGNMMFEVRLLGEGKLVKTMRQQITSDLVIAGDDKNDTAWFVVIAVKSK